MVAEGIYDFLLSMNKPKIVNNIDFYNCDVIQPINLLKVVLHISKGQFEFGQQHDSQEFLNWILDAIHEGLFYLKFIPRRQYCQK